MNARKHGTGNKRICTRTDRNHVVAPLTHVPMNDLQKGAIHRSCSNDLTVYGRPLKILEGHVAHNRH